MEMYFKRMKDEWTGLVEQADPLIRAKAAEIAVAHAHYLSIEFYRIVRIDPHAEEFLSNEQVERQLKSAMERWIINVLSARVDDVERLIQIQHTVAEVHARIGIPVEIVEMGFRVLKKSSIRSSSLRIIPPQKNFRSTISLLTVLISLWK